MKSSQSSSEPYVNNNACTRIVVNDIFNECHECSVCCVRFTDIENLQRHLTEKRHVQKIQRFQEKERSDVLSTIIFQKNLPGTSRQGITADQIDSAVTEDGLFRCLLCNNSYDTKSSYLLHVRSLAHIHRLQEVIGVNEFSFDAQPDLLKCEIKLKCLLCGLYFEEEKKLIEHIVYLKHHSSPEDAKRLVQLLKEDAPANHQLLVLLSNNFRRFVGDLVYCTLCDLKFNRLHKLESHQATLKHFCRLKDNQIGKHLCNVCRLRFTTKHQLITHYKRPMHMLRTAQLSCAVCSQPFISVDLLNKHLSRTSHGPLVSEEDQQLVVASMQNLFEMDQNCEEYESGATTIDQVEDVSVYKASASLSESCMSSMTSDGPLLMSRQPPTQIVEASKKRQAIRQINVACVERNKRKWPIMYRYWCSACDVLIETDQARAQHLVSAQHINFLKMTTGFDDVEAIVREEVDQLLSGGRSDHLEKKGKNQSKIVPSSSQSQSKMMGMKILRPRGYRPTYVINAVGSESAVNYGALLRRIESERMEMNSQQRDVKDPFVFSRALTAAAALDTQISSDFPANCKSESGDNNIIGKCSRNDSDAIQRCIFAKYAALLARPSCMQRIRQMFSVVDSALNGFQRRKPHLRHVGAFAADLLMEVDKMANCVLFYDAEPEAADVNEAFNVIEKELQNVTDGKAYSVNDETTRRRFFFDIDGFGCQLTVGWPLTKNNGDKVEGLSRLGRGAELAEEVLVALRRTSWFCDILSTIEYLDVVVVVLRDFVGRLEAWRHLSEWDVEVLCVTALNTADIACGNAADALRIVLEAIINPAFLSVVADPCDVELRHLFDGGRLVVGVRQAWIAAAGLALQQLSTLDGTETLLDIRCPRQRKQIPVTYVPTSTADYGEAAPTSGVVTASVMVPLKRIKMEIVESREEI